MANSAEKYAIVVFRISGKRRDIHVFFAAYAASSPSTAWSYVLRNSSSRDICSRRSRVTSHSILTGLCAVARQS